MIDPCKACAEIICMGICADQVQYKQEYQEMADRIRQQIINRNRRGERGQEKTKTVSISEEGAEDAGRQNGETE